ncbi:MAG: hypothetical protein IPN81_03690 [Nitrosomonadales bacterium]|nr:hypothetical protein [Nitrosomonadales bacterium]MBL0037815.1 hypothetical protein [Nitrosomonadales bacterium]
MLSLDSHAITHIDQLASTTALGHPMDMRDKFIAGFARSWRATLATRKVWHFDDLSREAFRQLNSQTRAVVRVVGGLCYSTGKVFDPVSAQFIWSHH